MSSSRVNPLRLKRLITYASLVTIAIILWTQLESIKDITKARNLPSTTSTATVVFSQKEIDPSTWRIQVKENEDSIRRSSLFPPVMFSKHNSRQYPLVTAIIGRVDDSDEGIIYAIQHLTKYPFIKEIIVYNQVKQRPLTEEQLQANATDVRIQVIETDASLDGMGKFAACAMATYGKCYFQDDLWMNPYLDSLYTHSFRYPDHLVANTRPVNYVDYMKWRFVNQDISLHTGYTDLRYGAFVPQYKVQRFLSQLSAQNLNSLQLKMADQYFSIWLNQYPYLISNPLLSLGRDGFKSRDSINNRPLVEHYMFDALSTMANSLMNASLPDSHFEKNQLSPPVEERDVRSSCANDQCLFITNMHSMPVPSLPFNPETMTNATQYDALYYQNFREEFRIPNKTTYAYQSYHKAVDSDTETCWRSHQVPKMDDYFGLYMVGDIEAKRVILYTSAKFDRPLDQVFKVTVQFVPFGSWEECKITNTPTSQLSYRIGFDFDCGRKEPFKSIRVAFQQDQRSHFELCGFGLDNFVV